MDGLSFNYTWTPNLIWGDDCFLSLSSSSFLTVTPNHVPDTTRDWVWGPLVYAYQRCPLEDESRVALRLPGMTILLAQIRGFKPHPAFHWIHIAFEVGGIARQDTEPQEPWANARCDKISGSHQTI